MTVKMCLIQIKCQAWFLVFLVDNFACSRTSEGRVGENLHLHLSDHAVLMGEFLATFRDLIGDVIEGLDEELRIGEVGACPR